MNETVKSLLNHRSIRKYSSKELKEEELSYILEVAQWAPSSIHGQGVSIIVVKDKENKDKLAHLVGDQGYVAEAPVFLIYCMDFNRAAKACEKNGLEIRIITSEEANLVGAVDVGLAMGNSIVAAESMGLGTVPIGGIRKNPMDVIEMLNLPKYVYPVCGLVVGYPEENPDQKPRMPKEVVLHDEKYKEMTKEQLDSYDKVISDYLNERTGGRDKSPWSQRIGGVYKSIYYPRVKHSLENQGFTGEE